MKQVIHRYPTAGRITRRAFLIASSATTAIISVVRVPGEGWIPLDQAVALKDGSSPYRVGWHTKGKLVADWPVMVTCSNLAERWLGMTWRKDTPSLIDSLNHPCRHSDPKFKDFEPGEAASIYGTPFYFEGKLSAFDFANVIAA